MKKLMTLVLALVMVVSMASMAFAGVYDSATGENTKGHVGFVCSDLVPSAEFDMNTVYGATVTFENNNADATSWQNGQIVFNGTGGCWNQFSFGPEGQKDWEGNDYSTYWTDNGDGTFSFTLLSDAPVFNVGDTVESSVKIGDWNDYQLTIKSIQLLDAEGNDVNASGDGGAGTPDGSVQTGDMTNIAILAGVAALALVAVVASKKANA